MKKKYEKPQVHIERFELAQHVAKCDWDFEGSLSAESCKAESNMGGIPGAIFANGRNGCTEILDPEDYERYCYFAGNTEWGATWNS